MNGLSVELIYDPDEGGYTARIPDVPAYGEGEDEGAAIADLKEALKAYIDEFGIEDALSRVNAPIKLHQITGNLTDFALA